MNDTDKLKNLILAPYIIKATSLIGKERKVGGNQFRHAFATLAILLDYKFFDDYVLLKASIIHDLLEDVPETDEQELRHIDDQSDQVLDLVYEVTRPKTIAKSYYLKKILQEGTRNAKILKVADRISNLTDLHRANYSKKEMIAYLNQTETFILPMAEEVCHNMAIELKDLISKRRDQIHFIRIIGFSNIRNILGSLL